MSDSKLDNSAMLEIPEQVTPEGEREDSTVIKGVSAPDTEFTPWREEPIPLQAATGLGHRRIVKKGKVLQGQPHRIKHEISFEPEPEPESKYIEVVPLKDGDDIIGLQIQCGCGATHEVRFEFSDGE